MQFYAKDWVQIGTRFDLADRISNITGIDNDVLRGYHPTTWSRFTVAERMSWASKRVTTRIEDVAYCLLGLFEVNMPLLYGEGENAFLRLQEEIMKHSDDQSLFAWSTKDTCYRGLLAKSPSSFSMCAGMNRFKKKNTPYSITNSGISIKLPMARLGVETYLAYLNCLLPYKRRQVGIFLKVLPESDSHFARVMIDGEDTLPIDLDADKVSKAQEILFSSSLKEITSHH